jgi:hypothetical protein
MLKLITKANWQSSTNIIDVFPCISSALKTAQYCYQLHNPWFKRLPDRCCLTSLIGIS